MNTCPFCNKKYRSRFWFENHLLFRHGFIKHSAKTILVDIFLAGFLLPTIIYFTFYAEPSLWDHIAGPKLRIDFYDAPVRLHNDSVILVDLTNEGGIDLHNIKATFNVVCKDGYNKDKIDYGTSEFDEPSYHLLRRSPSKQIYFRNEKLIERIDNQKNVSCSDSVIEVFEFRKVNDTLMNLENVYLFKYLEKEKSIKTEEFEDYRNVTFGLCWYCDYTINITAEEGSFSKHIEKRHTIFESSPISVQAPNPPFSGDVYYDRYYLGNGEISCIPCLIDEIVKENPRFGFLSNWGLNNAGLSYKNCTMKENTLNVCGDAANPPHL